MPLSLACVRTSPCTFSGPLIARGRAVTTGTASLTVTGNAEVALIVTVGSTRRSTCNPPSIAMGIGRLSTRTTTTVRQATAAATTRLESTKAAGQR